MLWGLPRYQDLAAKGATPERPGVSIQWFNAIYQVLLGEAANAARR